MGVVIRLALTWAKYLPWGFFLVMLQPPFEFVVVLPTLREVPKPGTIWKSATRRPVSHSSKSDVTRPPNFLVPLRCLIVMSLGELNVCGVLLALGEAEVGEAEVGDGERDGDGEVCDGLGEDEAVALLDADGDALADALGLLLADADALGLPLAEALPEGSGSGHSGRSGSISQIAGGSWALAGLIVCLLRLANTGDSAASINTHKNRATRAFLRAFLRPSSSRGIERSPLRSQRPSCGNWHCRLTTPAVLSATL